MFKFIENAMAIREIKRHDPVLDELTTEDLANLDDSIELAPQIGYGESFKVCFGAEGDGDDDEIGTAQFIKEVLLQQTAIKDDKSATTIAKMISKLAANKIPSNPGMVRRFFLKSGFTEADISSYYKGIVALSQTPYYNNLIVNLDQSIVDGVQEAVNNSTPISPIQNPVVNNPQGQQWGFQPTPGLISPAQVPVQPTVSPITPVAPSTPVK